LIHQNGLAWWAHLVGAPRVTRINVALTFLRKKIEERRDLASVHRKVGTGFLAANSAVRFRRRRESVADAGSANRSAQDNSVLVVTRILVYSDSDLSTAYDLAKQIQLTPVNNW
jgi:hypothetical protein